MTDRDADPGNEFQGVMASPTPVTAPPEDLGFGSVVGGAQQRRMINRDGTFTARRVGRGVLSYVNGYHALLTMSWPRFLGMVVAAYAAVNAVFGLAFVLCGPGALRGLGEQEMGGRFLRAFFFSIETFGTIGFGAIYPVGAAANWLVSVESLVALLFAALLTGLVFARFARPTAAIMFSEVAVVAPYHGISAFMFRIANGRSNQLMELEAKVLYSRLDGRGRRYDQLKLERTKVVFFPLSWTIVHPIDESSPLWGKSHEDLVENDAEFDILLAGADETFAQQVHSRSSYKPEEITFGAKFTNIYNPVAADGTLSINLRRLSEVEPAPLDGDGHRHTQTFRHTGHFTQFIPPVAPPGAGPRDRR